MDMCDSWLPNNNNVGFSLRHFAYFMKCFMYERKFSAFIQPDGLAEPAGAPCSMWSLKLTLGNTKKGGIVFPNAFIPIQIVTSCPRLADVMPPTCLIPFSAKTFDGLSQVVTPVSSTL